MALVGTLQWLVYLLGLCGPAVSVLPCCSSHPVRQAQSEFTCGRDCLFIWLGLNNISVDQETLSGVVSVGASGSSLHELQLAATQFGLPSEVVDFGGGGLSTLPLPAIVHVQIPNQELGGHFVVLVNRSLGRVFVIDPDLPKVVAMDEAELALIATGYALVSREGMRGTSMFWRQLAFVSIVGLTIVALLAIFRSLRKSRIVLGLVLFVLFGGGCDSDVQEGFVDGKSSTEPVELSKAALSWGQNSKDFGLVVEPEVEVKFLLRNESSDLVELFLSEVSCACLTAKLNKREMLPGEQIEVVLTLSHGGLPGERRGSVSVGVKGSRESHRFSARAVFEGVSGHTLIFRKEPGVQPNDEVLVGRIVTAPSVVVDDIQLDNFEWKEEFGRPNVVFSNFTVNEVRRNGVYSEFQYKVTCSPEADPKIGSFAFRMNLRVASKISSYPAKLLAIVKSPEGSQN